jgi:hypothetical protein
MAEVSVNIRGRDDGFGSMLDSLRDKANQLGKDVGNLDNFDSLTKTEKRIEIENVNSNVTQSRRQSVQDEFSQLRESNLREFSQVTQDHINGRISDREYNQHSERFEQSSNELNLDEQNELNAIEKESSNYLKQILRQLQLQERLDRERRQRDGSEFSDGSIGSLLNQNRDLRGRQNGTTDQAEIDELQSQIDANNDVIRGMRNNGREVDGDGGGFGGNYNRFTSGLQSGAGAAARGDLSGTLMGGLQMAGGVGKVAAGLTIAGIVAMIVKEFFGHGEKIQEAIGQTAAMRAGSGYTAGVTNQALQLQIASTDILGNLGLSGDEFAGMVNQKAMATGRAGNNVVGRTLDDFAFQKGFGADVGMFSQFERFSKNQETATTIGLDVLNVLTSIDKSSLKEGDLSTLSEKLNSQNSILTLQRSKRDIVDNDSALRILASFEKAGLSGKGDKGGDFLNQTIQGLGEGGGDNEMLFKYEAAKRARPDLAGDPAALRRFVKFNSDDPKYQAEFFKFAKKVSGGSKMAEDDILYSMFNPQSEKDMDIYGDLMNNKDGSLDTLSGKVGIDKTRKGTLNSDTMYKDAQSSVGAISTMTKDFSNTMQELLVEFKSMGEKFDKGFKILNWPSWFSGNKTKSGK